MPSPARGILDLQSLGSASSIGADDGFDTDRVTLPSLCSPDASKQLNSEEYFSGANVIVSRDKVSVWDGGVKVDRAGGDDGVEPLPLRVSPDFVRRRLHTPPDIRRRIHALQQARRDRSAAQGIKSTLLGDQNTDSVPSSAAYSDPRSRDGLKSRARSGAASREVALRIIQERQRAAAEREKEVARKEKAHAAMMHAAGGGMKHSGAHSHSHAYLHSTSEEDKEARRQANEKRKRDKGTVATLRKKPASPPKTAGDAASRGGMYGGMENEPEATVAVEPPREGEGEDVGDDLSVDASVVDADPVQADDDKSVASVASSHSLLTAQSSGTSETRRQRNTVAAGTQEALRLLQHANDAILEEQHTAYFGSQAKAAMRQKFLGSSRSLQKYPKDEDVPGELRSPRSMYLREAQKRSLVPLSLTVRKRIQPRGVFLGGRGLGDTRIMPIISVIDALPAIEAIDLSDNRMTDDSLCPLTVKLRTLRTLTHLDLSFNKMDESSKTIMDYIRDPTCTLKALILNGADVDDYEVGHLCDAMIENASILTLGLSRNLLGTDEHRKLLEPGLELAGDGLARLLLKNRRLTSLDLSWNSLRASCANAIGRALKRNRTLKTLHLQFNSFGDLGTQSVGYALKYNSSLTELDLSNNSIVPRSACVLANALSHNESLSFLNLSDNVLGRVGGQAVVAAIQRSQDIKRIIKFGGCDCSKEDPSLFDPARPQGTWTLDLSEPYGQMIAEECFFLANFRAGCSIEQLVYEQKVIPLTRSSLGHKKFSLKEIHQHSKTAAKAVLSKQWPAAAAALAALMDQFSFSMQVEVCLEVVQMVGKNWAAKQARKNRSEDLHEVFLPEVFYALFIINDEDVSGTMELDEFLSVLESLGMTSCDPLTAKLLMDEHDRGGTGSISGGEFSMIMVHQFCRTDLPRGSMVVKATGQPWPIASSGRCVLEMRFVIDAASSFDVGSDDGVEGLLQGIVQAKTSEQRDIMFNQACTSPYFFLTSDQAQLLFDTAMTSGLSKLPLDMIVSILPQIVNEEQVIRFLDMNLTDLGKLALRIKMGPLYNAFVGLPTGHYCIDFSKTLDCMGSKRLAAVSVNENKTTRAAGINLSQKGNWTNFRNEIIGNNYYTSTPIAVNGQWFAAPPSSGELRFDYVSTRRALVGTLPLADARFAHLVEHMGLRSILELQPVADHWAEQVQAAQAALQAGQAGLAAGANMRQLMQVKELKDALKETTRQAQAQSCVQVHSPLTFGACKEHFNEFMDSCHHHLDILPEERMRDVSRMNYNPDPDFRPPTPDVLSSGPPPSRRQMPAIYPYAYRKLLDLQIQMPVLFFSVAQTSQLMALFPQEGYLRIQLLLAVFSHLTDAENLCDIYDNLSADERAELVHRVGILCLTDPMRPDREYRLDLRRWDQREMCKILIQLGINEPGDNWVDGGEYRWSKYDDPVPGWILPAPWATSDEASDGDGGPRNYGWLRVTYTSTAKDCVVNNALRRNLRRRTLAGVKSVL